MGYFLLGHSVVAELKAYNKQIYSEKFKFKVSEIKQKRNFQVKSASNVLLWCKHNMTAKL